MPFDPNEYLAKKEVQTATPSAGAQKAFDPNSYLSSKGFNELPNNGNIENGASTAKTIGDTYQKFAPVAAKGLLPGGQYGAPLLEAGAGAVDQTVNGTNAFGDTSAPDQGLISRAIDAIGNLPKNFKRASNTQLDKIAQTETEHPIASALTEIASSMPASILASKGLADLGLNTYGQAGSIASTYGFANSNSQDLLGKLGDAAWAGLTTIALVKGLDKTAELASKIKSPGKIFINENTGLPQVDTLSADSVGIDAKPRSNGDFEIKFKGTGGKVSDAFKLSKEEGKLLGNKELQAKVEDEIINVFGSEENPGKIPTIIKQTKDNLGVIRDGVLKDKGALPTDTETALKRAWDKTQTYDTGGDVEKERAIADLKSRLQSVEFNLRAKSPSSSLNDIPVSEAFGQKQDLGEKLFGKSQLYKKASDVRSIVQTLWSDLGKAVGATDPQIKTLTDGFATLYKMENNAINSVGKIEALTSPNAGEARKAYKDFISPMLKMDPNVRASLMPELQEYVANELPKTLNKKAVIQAVTNQADSAGGLGWLLNKVYLNKGTLLKAAGTTGALTNVGQSAGSALAPGLKALGSSPIVQSTLPMTGALVAE